MNNLIFSLINYQFHSFLLFTTTFQVSASFLYAAFNIQSNLFRLLYFIMSIEFVYTSWTQKLKLYFRSPSPHFVLHTT
jgi:hypothetical protein